MRCLSCGCPHAVQLLTTVVCANDLCRFYSVDHIDDLTVDELGDVSRFYFSRGDND